MEKMKRSASDWDFENFMPEIFTPVESPPSHVVDDSGCGDGNIADVFCFIDRDVQSSHSPGDPLTGSHIWSQNQTLYSNITATIESQSSICAGSPTSSLMPKSTENQAPGGTSDSEKSDDESLEA